jgi:Domain of unknown function (DUF4153)
MVQQRSMMALVGALAGGSLYLLSRLLIEGVLAERMALFTMTAAWVFFASVLILIGPMELVRAATRAALQALVVAGLVTWASLRFDQSDAVITSPFVVVSALILSVLPLPFLLAEEEAGWRDYPSLFSAAWGMVMRSTVAWVFVGLLWVIIYLSSLLLGLVGADFITNIVTLPPAPWLITGTAFGLAMAVALELAEVVSAFLVLRLLRLLVPVVLVVMVVFLAAVGVNGFSGLFGAFSVSAILMLMSGVAATLVTSAVDQSDADAAASGLMQRAAQALGAIIVLPSALAAWAVWQRVVQHGWTPDRLFAATAALVGLGYGLAYLVAILRGRGWMERIRQANIAMALILMGLAVVWLTPVLNPERIATGSQMARIAGGRTDLAQLDVTMFNQWGRAGAAARAQLAEMAKTDPVLAKRLAEPGAAAPPPEPDVASLRETLQTSLPVQPALATALRDQILAAAGIGDLSTWATACALTLPQGGPGCVMVVADFIPAMAGEEALLILNSEGGYVTYIGLSVAGGSLQMLEVDSATGELENFDTGAALIADLQQALPGMQPVPRNELIAPVGGGLSLKP